MKLTIIIAVALVAVGVGLHFAPSEYTVVNERIENIIKEEEPLMIDVIDQAKQELERINAELDAEETSLLKDVEDINAEAKAEVERINAEAKAKVNEKKARLERIRETRSSFQ